LWIALVSATGKVPDAQTIVLSNAGFNPGGKSWQWRVRQTAERAPWGHLFSTDGIVATWITREWVEQMRALLPPPSFERVILNRWTSGAGDFVTAEQWRACVDRDLRPAGGGRVGGGRVFIGGLDLGLTKDRTAFAVAHRVRDTIVLDELVVWEGTHDRPVSIAGIERALKDAAQRYRPFRVLADPWQFVASIQRLRREGVLIDEFVFGAASVQRLSMSLYHAITSGSLRVFPDEELEREILGLIVRETAGGWRVDHRAGGYSDRVMALAMAVHGASQTAGLPAGVPSIHPLPVTAGLDRQLGGTGRGAITDGLLERPW
jgi:hypothetical protein